MNINLPHASQSASLKSETPTAPTTFKAVQPPKHLLSMNPNGISSSPCRPLFIPQSSIPVNLRRSSQSRVKIGRLSHSTAQLTTRFPSKTHARVSLPTLYEINENTAHNNDKASCHSDETVSTSNHKVAPSKDSSKIDLNRHTAENPSTCNAIFAESLKPFTDCLGDVRLVPSFGMVIVDLID